MNPPAPAILPPMRTRLLVPLLLLPLAACSSAPTAAPTAAPPESSSAAPESTVEASEEPLDSEERSASIGVMEVGGLTIGLEDLPDGYSRYAAANSEALAFGSPFLLDCMGTPIEVGDDETLRTTAATPVFANEGSDIRVIGGAAMFYEAPAAAGFFEDVDSSYASCFDEQLQGRGEEGATERLSEVESSRYPDGIEVLAFRTETTVSEGEQRAVADTVFLRAGELTSLLYVFSTDSPVAVDDVQSLVDLLVDRLDDATT